jgi:hypothetical protein
MDPEAVCSFANALAVIAVFGSLILVILESRDHNKADVPTIAPILAAVGVIIFLTGNVLRYVLAAYGSWTKSQWLSATDSLDSTRAAGSGAGLSRHFHLGFGGIGSLVISASRHQIDDRLPSQKLLRK